MPQLGALFTSTAEKTESKIGVPVNELRFSVSQARHRYCPLPNFKKTSTKDIGSINHVYV